MLTSSTWPPAPRSASAASRTVAATLCLRITDLDTALSTGLCVVRLRNQIPGEDSAALATAIAHLSWLEGSRHTALVPAAAGPVHDSSSAPPLPSVRTSRQAP
ncbi:hypothetical protein [Streptomyces sp. NPDC052693]|uniref:hypothetical protein n=1 Tax=Streptomyces sp. NPDC052693 TaxID=3155814 RepID=UPI00342EA417